MNGRDGDDWLWGGAGRDRLTGGAGQDTFHFRDGDSSAANPDVITDLALSDIIDLNAIDADTTVANDQAFTLVSHFTSAAGQLVVHYDSAAAVTHVMMDTDGDGVADQVIDATANHAGFTQFLL
jgi:Ca2+-binding RTX toxin-like protein